jgi:hypothetical protein
VLIVSTCRCTFRQRSCWARAPLRMQRRPGPQRRFGNSTSCTWQMFLKAAAAAILQCILQGILPCSSNTLKYSTKTQNTPSWRLVCCSQAGDCYAFGVVLWELVTGELPVRARMRCVFYNPQNPLPTCRCSWMLFG